VFIGHFGVAFAAKRAVPTVSLGTWFVACELIDLIWPLFLLLGIEAVVITPGITAFSPFDFVHYPWTHSLSMCALWALGMAAAYWLLRRNVVAAALVGMAVLSHWFLDVLVHRPDLPLAPGSDVKIGFGLWNSVPGTLLVEIALFALGLGFYRAGSRPVDRVGGYGLWALVVLLFIAYTSAAFGPPPPNAATVAWAGLLGGVLTAALGYWIDRHRSTKG
jgi:LexA-binding, inner membrane-associated putative hydrolase